jgi:hypothetical protein
VILWAARVRKYQKWPKEYRFIFYGAMWVEQGSGILGSSFPDYTKLKIPGKAPEKLSIFVFVFINQVFVCLATGQ